MKQERPLRQLAAGGVVAALYAALTLLTGSFAYGPIQFRIADALIVLCCFSRGMTMGMTAGCLLANLFSPVSALDALVGTVATLIACRLTKRIRRPWLLPLPNVLVNGLFIGAELAWSLTPEAFWQGFAINGGQVALGELAVMVVLGIPLYLYLQKSQLLHKLHVA